MQFDKSCDNKQDLENFAPVVRCDTACITVLEPQFFGGILNEKKPYTFVRGCATDIFAVSNARVADLVADLNVNGGRLPPAEIDFLHRDEICVALPIQELWPELFESGKNPLVFDNSAILGSSRALNSELVKVCSCMSNACNTHDALSSGAASLLEAMSFHWIRIASLLIPLVFSEICIYF